MNELQPAQHNLPQSTGSLGAIDVSPGPIIDVAGPGFKRDYAGLLEYWQMVRRHKGAVIVATFLGGTIGFLLTFADPRIYQARTTVEIQGLNDEFLNMKNSSPTVDANAHLDTDIQTQVKILQSRLLTSRVRERLEALKRPDDLQPPDRLGVWRKVLTLNPPDSETLWRQALNMAAGDLKVRSSGATRIVEVSCDSTNARVAADFCNTLTHEYIEENLQSRWKTTEYTGQWLTKQLQDLKIKIEKQEEELQTYVRATGLMFTSNTNDQEAKLADVQKELFTAQADRISKQSKFEMASTSPPGALPDVLDDVSLKESQKALADLRTKLAQLRITFTDSHAEVRRIQAQISAIEASLDGVRANVLTRIRKDYEGAQRREALLTSAYTAQAGLVSGKAEQAAHYGLLKRDVDATRLLYETLLQRLKEASITSALRANNIRVVDAAEPPSTPYKPDVRQTSTFGLLIGLALGITLVVIRERADRTLQDPGDVSYFLGLPELGVVPIGELLNARRSRKRSKVAGLQLRNGGSPGGGALGNRVEMTAWRQKDSMLAESFRATLTSILFSRRSGDRPRVLVLTSASPQEGKTTVVTNLSISLAAINHTVLLIDGDMRRPRLHTLFDIQNGHGLSDLLLEKTPLDAATLDVACLATAVPGLYVLPSGNSRRNASSLLHSPRLTELVGLARARFDTIVVDTPPVINIADARLLARLADALILVVRSGITTRDAALRVKGQLAEDGIPILGTILNFWNPKTPGYAYYGYYYAKQGYFGNGNGNSGGDGQGSGDDDAPAPAPVDVFPHGQGGQGADIHGPPVGAAAPAYEVRAAWNGDPQDLKLSGS